MYYFYTAENMVYFKTWMFLSIRNFVMNICHVNCFQARDAILDMDSTCKLCLDWFSNKVLQWMTCFCSKMTFETLELFWNCFRTHRSIVSSLFRSSEVPLQSGQAEESSVLSRWRFLRCVKGTETLWCVNLSLHSYKWKLKLNFHCIIV